MTRTHPFLLGEVCTNLIELQTDYDRLRTDVAFTTFFDASQSVLEELTSPYYVHVYHIAGTAVELVVVLIAVCTILELELGGREVGCVVVVDDDSEGSFVDVVDFLAERLGGHYGDDDVRHFQKDVHVVRGISIPAPRDIPFGPTSSSTSSSEKQDLDHANTNNNDRDLEQTLDRTTRTIISTASSVSATGTIWHETASVTLLLSFLHQDKLLFSRRNKLILGICITSALDISADSFTVHDDFHGPGDLSALRRLSTRLLTPLLFVSMQALGLRLGSMNQMPGWARLWPRMIPEGRWWGSVKRVFDEVTTTAFQLADAMRGTHGVEVLDEVREYRSSSSGANSSNQIYENGNENDEWMHKVLSPSSYTRHKCTLTHLRPLLPSLATTLSSPLPLSSLTHPLSLLLLLPHPALSIPACRSCGVLAIKTAFKLRTRTFRLDPDARTYILLQRDYNVVKNRVLDAWERWLPWMVRMAERGVRGEVAGAWRGVREMVRGRFDVLRQAEGEREGEGQGKGEQLDWIDWEWVREAERGVESGVFAAVCGRD
ncbi:hypothetical protein K402DRAFT_401624 [Aulographum hederae CBS 113979]|uniref:Uncharacterized protein n=1 Tax=Aulographum hederae CBS 113979 TaxID=1176131 RepID=A0A6G1HAS3_9PEZI|nr:hypothetical protein K402DRAFT_401624 [Aulographum hederae CBS 113979]